MLHEHQFLQANECAKNLFYDKGESHGVKKLSKS